MMRGLSDQMEPAPPQVQELRAALAVYRRAADEWRERAQKAEAEVARFKGAAAYVELYNEVARLREAEAEVEMLHGSLGIANKTIEDMNGEVARLREVLEEADEILTEMGWHTDRGLLQSIRAALAKGGGYE